MRVDSEVLNILELCSTEDNMLFLPPIQLDRKLYVKVNDVLAGLGGKWDRKNKGHIFEEGTDPWELVESVLVSGETTDLKREFNFFPTPKDIVEKIIELSELKDTDNVLEPSAGQGNIADEIKGKCNKLQLIELNSKNCEILRLKGYDVLEADFLTVVPDPTFDVVLMNPPFSKQQDITHVTHAFKFLKPDGRLVAVMSEGPFFRDNNKSVAFREFLDSVGYSMKLEEGTFKESGTTVKTRLVVLRKNK